MDFIEGISNEVLVAFIATVLLLFISVYYIFVSKGPSSQQAVSQTAEHVSEQESSDNFAGNPSENTVDNDAVNISQGDPNIPSSSSSVDSGLELNNGVNQDNTRRRVVNELGYTQSSASGELMVVKVKHNEDIQTFNVSKNTTVIELKRLAFNNELNAGRRVRFVYAGQLLRNDNDLLIQYGVLPNTVVHCVISDQPAEMTSAELDEGGDLDLSRVFLPLLGIGVVLLWCGLISFKHMFTVSSIAILFFLTCLYVLLVFVQ